MKIVVASLPLWFSWSKWSPEFPGHEFESHALVLLFTWQAELAALMGFELEAVCANRQIIEVLKPL